MWLAWCMVWRVEDARPTIHERCAAGWRRDAGSCMLFSFVEVLELFRPANHTNAPSQRCSSVHTGSQMDPTKADRIMLFHFVHPQKTHHTPWPEIRILRIFGVVAGLQHITSACNASCCCSTRVCFAECARKPLWCGVMFP